MAKKCTVQYRQLKTDGIGEGANLKAMIVDVLQRRARGQALAENAKLRKLDIDQDNSFVILNKLSPRETWGGPIFAGQLIHLQEGSDVHAVTQSLDDDTDEFVLQSLNVGEQARVLKGALYFAVIGNNVGLIEGTQVKGRTLERYLTRMFQDAGELEPGQAIILNGKFLAGDGKELSESSEIEIAAVPNNNQGQPRREVAIAEREAAQAREEGATVFDVLRVLGWTPEALERLRGEVPDDGTIEGYFKVFIKERRKKKPISRATINEALRNIDPADIGLRGDGREKGGIVKLSTLMSVDAVNSLLDPTSAMEQIVNALRMWAEAGRIDCNFAG
ncbi:hypothetical protein [Sphingobium fuliginis]|uniref:DUF932 domain-containing protein n=1 Tax=Sphingobium fuliginis (strain ATCC 27551) TaxID=336203 RepID=A0ABQ1ETD9_SPHSA|nr:hypothetical protein [Sphingobium fuliginis]RYL99489.1 hypothetical protein EWH10_06340 [Sphingobium fuliginis]GFZ85118.1 hypothetical protein GCM10019071_12660 [Sphingobium fuliginis]